MAGIDSNTKLIIHGDGGDASKSHPITFNGTAQLDTAQFKFGTSSVLFDGDSDYLTIPDHADWDFIADETTEWTLDFWVKASSTSPAAIRALFGQYEDVNNYWKIVEHNSNGLQLEFYSNGSTWTFANSSTFLTTSWQHIAVCNLNESWGVYLNGTQIVYLDQNSHTDTFAGSLYIARNINTNHYFDGYIDAIRISKENIFGCAPVVGKTDTITPPTEAPAATSSTLLLINANGADAATACNDEAGGDTSYEGGGNTTNHITTYQETAQLDTAQSKWGGASILADGDSDYIQVPRSSAIDIASSTATDWTIDMWVRFNSIAAPMTFFDQRTDSNNGIIWHWYQADVWTFNIRDSSTEIINMAESVAWTAADTWYHIAICKVGADWGMYRDGTQVAYDEQTATCTRTEDMKFGTMTGLGRYMNGWFDEIRIQNSNYFGAAPNSTPDDTIVVPTEAYSYVPSVGFSQGIIIV